MSTTTATAPTIPTTEHTLMGATISRSGDYATDCLEAAAEAIRGIGCTDVEPEPSMGAAVCAEDGDDTVLAGVVVVGPDQYEFTLDEPDGMVCGEMGAELAALSTICALATDPPPLSLRADVMSVCLDTASGRAHHVRDVWRRNAARSTRGKRALATTAGAFSVCGAFLQVGYAARGRRRGGCRAPSAHSRAPLLNEYFE